MSENERAEENNQNKSEAKKKQPLWIEVLDSYLTDEFRYKLKEVFSSGIWALEVMQGDMQDPIKFFDYFDTQIKRIYELKEKPSELRNYFYDINPGRQSYEQGGLAKNVAHSRLPILRQQVFILNALFIVIKKRLENDERLRIAANVLNNLLQLKVSDSFRTLGVMTENPEWNYLVNRIDTRATLTEKANEVLNFLTEIILKSGIKSEDDSRNILLFMKEQIEIPYVVITQNNNKYKNVFGDNFVLEKLCVGLYYEFHRLFDLSRLEGLQHSEDITLQRRKIQPPKKEISVIKFQVQIKEKELGKEDDENFQEIKQRKWLEYALDYADDPEQIGKYIYENIKSELKTSRELFYLKLSIEALAQALEIKPEYITPKSEPKKTFQLGIISSPPIVSIEAPILTGIWKLAKELRRISNNYYNKHKLTENDQLGGEDDPNATPLSFFSFPRIMKYVRSLSEDAKRYQYLLSMKNAFIDKDKKGFTRFDDETRLKADEDLLRKLESEIATYERALKINDPINKKSTERNDESNLDEVIEKKLTARQWMIAMRYFIDGFKIRSIEKINFARFLAVLNGGKNLQEFRAKLEARDLITAQTAHDAQQVADLFRDLKLPEIAQEIENAINKINDKNL